MVFYKIPNFQIMHLAVRYVIKIHTNNTHAKFQNNIFIFGCAIAKKAGKGDGVTS